MSTCLLGLISALSSPFLLFFDSIRFFFLENAHLKTDKQELNEKRQQVEVELQKTRLALEQIRSIQVRGRDGGLFWS